MTKKGTDKPKREPTRRQLSRWQQEKKRNRIILITGITIIAAIVLTVTIGWFMTEYRPMHETVLKVNDKSFDMGYFVNMLKIYGKGQSPDYLYTLVGQLPRIIETDELISKGAAGLNITVSDDDVKSALSKRNLSNDYWDIVKAGLIQDKLLSDHFDSQVPQSAEQRQVQALFLESRSQAEEIASRLDKGESITDLAKEFSLDSFSKSQAGDLGWHPEGILTIYLGTNIVDQYSFGTHEGAVSPPIRDEEKSKSVGYWLIKVLETKEEAGTKQVHAQAILVGSAEEAQGVKTRLENGEDFATVAKEVSQHTASKENGGDLDWVQSGVMGTAFDGFAFSTDLEIGKLSDPIRDDTVTTKGGYWLIKVIGSEADRKITDDDRSILKNKALQDWVTSLFADPSNTIDESLLTQEKMITAVLKAAEV